MSRAPVPGEGARVALRSHPRVGWLCTVSASDDRGLVAVFEADEKVERFAAGDLVAVHDLFLEQPTDEELALEQLGRELDDANERFLLEDPPSAWLTVETRIIEACPHCGCAADLHDLWQAWADEPRRGRDPEQVPVGVATYCGRCGKTCRVAAAVPS